jgi:hypothetical protein
VLDADTHQPGCFTTGTSARTPSHAAEGLRTRLAPPAAGWDAAHLAKDYFAGLEGDVRRDIATRSSIDLPLDSFL